MTDRGLPRGGGDRRGFAADVRRVVSAALGERHPKVQVVARSLGMSSRTLQRRLSAAGLTYASLVAQTRADMARRLLSRPTPRIGDVARAIGYSDAGHFTRAFQRWTGLTPREFRRLGRRSAT